MRPLSLAGPMLLACALLAAAPARAQTFYGRVLDVVDAAPVSAATVTAIDSTGRGVASALTDAAGRYELALPQPGSLRLRVERIGYAPSLSSAVPVGAGQRVQVDLPLRSTAVALATVAVEAERVPMLRDARARTFFERERRGRGRYINPQRVRELDRRFTSDLLRTVPGVSFSRGVGSSGLRLGSGRSACTPLLYIDGNRFRPYPGWRLDSHVRAADVWAVEVYRYAEDIPPELPRDMDSRCGIVVIWTKEPGT